MTGIKVDREEIVEEKVGHYKMLGLLLFRRRYRNGMEYRILA